MVELYFRITKDIVAFLMFHFYFVVVCYMLTTEFQFPEIGKIYLFSLKGEMYLVITVYLLLYILKVKRLSLEIWKSGKIGLSVTRNVTK